MNELNKPWRFDEKRIGEGSGLVILFKVLAGVGRFNEVVITERRTLGDSPGTRAAFKRIAEDHNEILEQRQYRAGKAAAC